MAINQQQFSNAYTQTTGQIPAATVFNYSTINSTAYGSLTYAQYIDKISKVQICENSYNSAWFTKSLRTLEVANTGTIPYAWTAAAVPVSNYSPSDLGNRSFTTAFQVFGTPILYLQTNFWVTSMLDLQGADEFKNQFQDLLLNSYSKSIQIVKAQLSALEAVMFSLATGQFFMVDFLGDNVVYNPEDPNNAAGGMCKILWNTQQPCKMSTSAQLVGQGKEYLKYELGMLSKFMMSLPLSVNMFAIGYDINKVHIDCSYYMRSNLAEAINLGWPTETNMNIINNKSYQGATVSQWLNVVLTDTGTVPFFQNNIPLVTQAQATSGVNNGSPLGYGINNVTSAFSYLKNVVGYISHEGSIEQYTTPYVPFIPYNTGNSKTWYRLGGVWGWGQVHKPVLAATNFALIDSKAYINITSTSQAASTNTDHDWIATLQPLDGNTTTSTLSDYYQTQTNPVYTATKISNGIEYTVNYEINLNQLVDDIIQSQTILQSWEPGMQYNVWNWTYNQNLSLSSVAEDLYNNDTVESPLPGTWMLGNILQTRSLRGLGTIFTNSITNQTQTLMDVQKIGNVQLAYTDVQPTFSYPNDAPTVS